jgi:hypothetical protein
MKWLLATMALLLSAWVTLQWWELSAAPEISAPDVPAPEIIAVVDHVDDYPQYDLAPLTEFEEVFERPLFSAERRPPPPEVEPEEVVEEPEPEPEPVEPTPFPSYVKLKAIWTVKKETFALFENMKEKSSLRLKIGDHVEDWQLAQISPSSASFSIGERSETLDLWVYAKPNSSAAPAQQPSNPLKDALLKRRAQQKAIQEKARKLQQKASAAKSRTWSMGPVLKK